MIAERSSVSRQRPVYVDWATHPFQKATVSSYSRWISGRRISRGGPSVPVSSTRPRTWPADSSSSRVQVAVLVDTRLRELLVPLAHAPR